MDPNFPKKYRCPYSVYYEEFEKKFKEDNLNPKDFSRLLAEGWENLPKEKLDEYTERYEKNNREYEQEVINYKKSGLYEDFRDLNRIKEYINMESKYGWEYSGYFLFIEKMFDEHCDMKVSSKENAMIFSKLWNELSYEEKNNYREKALEEKEKSKNKVAIGKFNEFGEGQKLQKIFNQRYQKNSK